MVEHELKEAWVSRMKSLVSRIGSRVVLLWLADHAPEAKATFTPEAADPLFVDRAMLQAVEPFVSGMVEVVVGPEEVWAGFDQLDQILAPNHRRSTRF